MVDLYFADETGFTQQPYVPYGWQKKHQPLLLPARTTTKRLNLLGLLRLDNHLTVYHNEKPLTGGFVVDSLTRFVNQTHAKPVVIVLDNGPIHRCQLVYDQQASWEDKDVYLFFLPPYSPHLIAPAPRPYRNPVADDEVPLATESELPVMESVEKSHLCHHQSLRPRIPH